MKQIAHWILRNSDNKIISEFESNIPPELLQLFLKQNFNLFDKDKFISFVKGYKEISNKYFVI